MKKKVHKVVIIIIPLLTLILAYGAIFQNRLYWSILILLGAISVLGLIMMRSTTNGAEQQSQVSLLRIEAGGVVGSLVALAGIVLYDWLNTDVLRWEVYGGLLLGSVLLLSVLGAVRLRKHSRR